MENKWNKFWFDTHTDPNTINDNEQKTWKIFNKQKLFNIIIIIVLGILTWFLI